MKNYKINNKWKSATVILLRRKVLPSMSEHFFPTNKNHKQSYEEKSKEMEIIPTWGDKDTLWSLLKLTIYLNLHIFIPFIIIISNPRPQPPSHYYGRKKCLLAIFIPYFHNLNYLFNYIKRLNQVKWLGRKLL